MSHSRDDLLPANEWEAPPKPRPRARGIRPTEIGSVTTRKYAPSEVCRIYVLPQRRRKSKRGKRK